MGKETYSFNHQMFELLLLNKMNFHDSLNAFGLNDYLKVSTTHFGGSYHDE